MAASFAAGCGIHAQAVSIPIESEWGSSSLFKHDPARKTGIHPRLREDMLLRIML
jgi:hypothetical protein